MGSEIREAVVTVPLKLQGIDQTNYSTVEVSSGGDIRVEFTNYETATLILDLLQANSLDSIEINVKGG